jgi:ABC-type glycerol-3-phosphate transport system permease component
VVEVGLLPYLLESRYKQHTITMLLQLLLVHQQIFLYPIFLKRQLRMRLMQSGGNVRWLRMRQQSMLLHRLSLKVHTPVLTGNALLAIICLRRHYITIPGHLEYMAMISNMRELGHDCHRLCLKVG